MDINKMQKRFDELRLNDDYGCGYWDVCWEHACPCQISIRNNPIFDEKIYKDLQKEAQEVAEQESEFNNYDYDGEDDFFMEYDSDEDMDYEDDE